MCLFALVITTKEEPWMVLILMNGIFIVPILYQVWKFVADRCRNQDGNLGNNMNGYVPFDELRRQENNNSSANANCFNIILLVVSLLFGIGGFIFYVIVS